MDSILDVVGLMRYATSYCAILRLIFAEVQAFREIRKIFRINPSLILSEVVNKAIRTVPDILAR
jgi:hypothetical protein